MYAVKRGLAAASSAEACRGYASGDVEVIVYGPTQGLKLILSHRGRINCRINGRLSLSRAEPVRPMRSREIPVLWLQVCTYVDAIRCKCRKPT